MNDHICGSYYSTTAITGYVICYVIDVYLWHHLWNSAVKSEHYTVHIIVIITPANEG